MTGVLKVGAGFWMVQRWCDPSRQYRALYVRAGPTIRPIGLESYNRVEVGTHSGERRLCQNRAGNLELKIVTTDRARFVRNLERSN